MDKTELILPLDFQTAEQAEAMIDQVKDLPIIYKVGFELFLSAGPEFVRTLTSQGYRVFLDLKFHDIPNTVRKGVLQAVKMGVDMFTLHLAGGGQMISAVMEELDAATKLGLKRPKVLGVSVLTSFDDAAWEGLTGAMTGTPVKPRYSVTSLVEMAEHWKVDGIVCSAHELGSVQTVNPKFYTVVPGIRPEGSAAGDQGRVMTPKQAHELGAKAIVVGRPITKASEPRKVVESILAEIQSEH